ncbi:MAG: dipeptidase [Candidatus Saccharibacteria bacterium]|nr:dipeptidase [Candidatus Saccharibacteria bacterium]
MLITAIGGGVKKPALQHTIETIGAEHTDVLILPSACTTQSSYDKKVPTTLALFESLGVVASVLHGYGERPTTTRIHHEIGRASLIHTIGGNSPYMMERLRETVLFQALKDALTEGKAHSGISAGALLPFQSMHSNGSRRPQAEDWDFQFIDGLEVLPGVVTAHADGHDQTPYGQRSDSRMDHLLAHFPAHNTQGLALENGASVIIGDEPELIRLNGSEAYHLARTVDDEVVTTVIEDSEHLRRIFTA